jgi:hypothetical protein
LQLGIINLMQEWDQVKTVGQALSTPPIVSADDSEIVEERKELEQILEKTAGLSRVMK